MLTEVFEAFGFSEKERGVILRLLEHGPQRASTVSRYCEIPRNTVRGMLDKLVGEGFLVRSRRGNTHYYAVESLEGLKRTLEAKRESVLEEVTHQLEVLDRTGYLLSRASSREDGRPRVTFYEGYQGLERVYEDTLSASEPLRSWGSFDENAAALPRYFRSYYKRRAKRKIHMTSIHPDSEAAREHQRNDKAVLRRSVLVPAGRFKITPEIQVYDDKINIVSWRDKLGIIIESKEIAAAVKAIFDLSLEGAKKLQGAR